MQSTGVLDRVAKQDHRAQHTSTAAMRFLRKLSSELDTLTDAEIGGVLPRLHSGAHRRRDRLFDAGDPSDRVFLVTRGHFKNFIATPDGRELILHVAGPGDLLGELCPLDGTYSTSAEAVSDASVLVVPMEVFAALCEQSPKFTMAISRVLAQRLAFAHEQAASVAHRSVSARLANLLAAHSQHAEDGTTWSIHLTHREMAEGIGACRETVTAMLGKFRAMGMIDIGQGRITLRDRDAFQACIRGELTVSTRHGASAL